MGGRGIKAMAMAVGTGLEGDTGMETIALGYYLRTALISTWPKRCPKTTSCWSQQLQTSFNSLVSCLSRSLFYFQTNP